VPSLFAFSLDEIVQRQSFKATLSFCLWILYPVNDSGPAIMFFLSHAISLFLSFGFGVFPPTNQQVPMSTFLINIPCPQISRPLTTLLLHLLQRKFS
jgi:hypothetical protein